MEASLVAQMVKNPPAIQETQVQSQGQEDPLEMGMAIHSSFLAWRIPWAEEPGWAATPATDRYNRTWTTGEWLRLASVQGRGCLLTQALSLETTPTSVYTAGRWVWRRHSEPSNWRHQLPTGQKWGLSQGHTGEASGPLESLGERSDIQISGHPSDEPEPAGARTLSFENPWLQFA